MSDVFYTCDGCFEKLRLGTVEEFTIGRNLIIHSECAFCQNRGTHMQDVTVLDMPGPWQGLAVGARS